MIFSSKHTIVIPPIDVLSYVFDKSIPGKGLPTFINADNPTERLDKQELEKVVRRLGKGLQDGAGLMEGEVVLACAENSIWYPVILLGTLCAGGIFTGANPSYTSTELAHQLKVSGARCIFTDEERLPTVLKAAKQLKIRTVSIYLINRRQDVTRHPGSHTIHELLNHGEMEWRRLLDIDVVSERIAVLNFSSGTTGPPKACMVTHHNLVANAEQTLVLDELARKRKSDSTYATGDVHCAYVPLYHAMGLLTFCIVNVRRDCTTVVMPKFGLVPLLRAIHELKVSYLLLVPPVAVLLIKSRQLVLTYDVSSVKFLLCGAAPLGSETSTQLENLFQGTGARVRQGYGMTESTMAVTLFAPDEFDSTHQGVGYLVANMEAKVINDDGKEVGYEEEGEAVVRGPNVFKGYFKNEKASKEAWTEDGWLKTGDYVIIQQSGLFRVVDRKKELIKVKGFQVSPSELEAHLLECNGVKDCAVIRVLRNGQEHPQAHIVAGDQEVTAESIGEFMKFRLSVHKQLTGGIIFTKSIPKSPSGKILRRLIKDPHTESNTITSRL